MPITSTTAARGYQLPNIANFLSDDVARVIAALNAIDTDMAAQIAALSGKAPAVHAHLLADVTGLVGALDGKADASHVHALTSLTGVAIGSVSTGQVLRFNGTNFANATLAVGDVSGLSSALDALTAADATFQLAIIAIDGGTF